MSEVKITDVDVPVVSVLKLLFRIAVALAILAIPVWLVVAFLRTATW